MKNGAIYLLLISLMFNQTGNAAQAQEDADLLSNPVISNFKAYAEFKMANYDKARRIWQLLASIADTEALFNLAILAEDGLGEVKNMDKAESLYVASANAGGYKAQYRLGLLYSADTSLPKDLTKARHYLNLAAAQGDEDAAMRLQSIEQPDHKRTDFETAEFLQSSGKYTEAAALYERAAGAGRIVALTRLGFMYERGRGVEHDLNRAGSLFIKAAQAGEPEAQYALAVMYRTGKGLPKNLELSYRWLKLSADNKYPPAQIAITALESKKGE